MLDRSQLREFLPYPKMRSKLSNILSREEMVHLIEASSGQFEHMLLTVLYARAAAAQRSAA